MLILVTYDVSTETSEGKRRLNRVAKKCIAFGQRVQNSVFECHLDWGEYIKFQNELKAIIDKNLDSLRFYNLGAHFDTKVMHIGQKPSMPIEGEFIV
jgi:CRISPR-associated protein Cas2